MDSGVNAETALFPRTSAGGRIAAHAGGPTLTMNTIQVAVPQGLAPGQVFVAQAPDGRQVQVTVPPGVEPGQLMAVQLPTTTNTLQVAIPEGLAPGQVFVAQAPDGRQVQVTVPAGMKPGQPMTVQLPPGDAPVGTPAGGPSGVAGAESLPSGHGLSIDVSGRSGHNGSSGHHGMNGHSGGTGSNGGSGSDGGNASNAEAGRPAGKISLQLQTAGNRIVAHADAHGDSCNGQRAVEQPAEGFMNVQVKACGGRGGDGGNGGNGGRGGNGGSGRNATRHSSGGNGGNGGRGGNGGSGSNGAPGGRGGEIVVRVAAQDAYLLMAVDDIERDTVNNLVRGGDGGTRGRHGHGGAGGSGGSGGSSYSWTETHGSGDNRYTTHHSNPGGHSGHSGSSGFTPSHPLHDGPDGAYGRVQLTVDGVGSFGARFDAAVTKFALDDVGTSATPGAGGDGVLEFGETLRLSSMEVWNDAPMPTPGVQRLRLKIEPTPWTMPNGDDAFHSGALAPAARATLAAASTARVAQPQNCPVRPTAGGMHPTEHWQEDVGQFEAMYGGASAEQLDWDAMVVDDTVTLTAVMLGNEAGPLSGAATPFQRPFRRACTRRVQYRYPVRNEGGISSLRSMAVGETSAVALGVCNLSSKPLGVKHGRAVAVQLWASEAPPGEGSMMSAGGGAGGAGGAGGGGKQRNRCSSSAVTPAGLRFTREGGVVESLAYPGITKVFDEVPPNNAVALLTGECRLESAADYAGGELRANVFIADLDAPAKAMMHGGAAPGEEAWLPGAWRLVQRRRLPLRCEPAFAPDGAAEMTDVLLVCSSAISRAEYKSWTAFYSELGLSAAVFPLTRYGTLDPAVRFDVGGVAGSQTLGAYMSGSAVVLLDAPFESAGCTLRPSAVLRPSSLRAVASGSIDGDGAKAHDHVHAGAFAPPSFVVVSPVADKQTARPAEAQASMRRLLVTPPLDKDGGHRAAIEGPLTDVDPAQVPVVHTLKALFKMLQPGGEGEPPAGAPTSKGAWGDADDPFTRQIEVRLVWTPFCACACGTTISTKRLVARMAGAAVQVQKWLRKHRPELGGVVVYAPHVESPSAALRTAFSTQSVVDGGNYVQLARSEDDPAKFLLGTLTVMLRREPHDGTQLSHIRQVRGTAPVATGGASGASSSAALPDPSEPEVAHAVLAALPRHLLLKALATELGRASASGPKVVPLLLALLARCAEEWALLLERASPSKRALGGGGNTARIARHLPTCAALADASFSALDALRGTDAAKQLVFGLRALPRGPGVRRWYEVTGRRKACVQLLAAAAEAVATRLGVPQEGANTMKGKVQSWLHEWRTNAEVEKWENEQRGAAAWLSGCGPHEALARAPELALGVGRAGVRAMLARLSPSGVKAGSHTSLVLPAGPRSAKDTHVELARDAVALPRVVVMGQPAFVDACTTQRDLQRNAAEWKARLETHRAAHQLGASAEQLASAPPGYLGGGGPPPSFGGDGGGAPLVMPPPMTVPEGKAVAFVPGDLPPPDAYAGGPSYPSYPTAYPTAVEVAGYPPAEGGAPPPAYPMPPPEGAGAAGNGTEGVVLVMGELSPPKELRTSEHKNHASM